MATAQIQIRLSLSEQLNQLLKQKAANVGLPVTQYVKHLIIKEVDEIPTFDASERTKKALKDALKELPSLKTVTDLDTYFDQKK